MAITQTQRILDLALSGLTVTDIAHGLSVAESVVETALQDLNSTPSGQSGAGSFSSIAVTGDLTAATVETSGNADVGGTLGVDGVATFDAAVVVGGELQGQTAELEHGLGVFGTEPPASAAAITGALSTVADAPAKAVLTSIIAALVATGQATDGTT